MRFLLYLLCLQTIICSPEFLLAQGSDSLKGSVPSKTSTVTPTITEQPQKPKESSGYDFRTEEEKGLTKLFLLFSGFVLLIATALLYKFSSDCNIAFKYFIIVLLVVGMLILLAIGFNENQISPAVGLFGTIAGYLLGRTDSKTEVSSVPPK